MVSTFQALGLVPRTVLPGAVLLFSYEHHAGPRDLIELELVKTLLDVGIELDSIRDAFTYLRNELGEDISSSKLVNADNHMVLVRRGR